MTWEEAILWLRAQPEQRDLVRACFYDDPLLGAAERYRESSEWRAIRGFLPASAGDVLDVGAGRGIAAYAFARDGWRVSALEPDPSAIVGAEAIRQLAEQGGVRIDVRREWGEHLPFPDCAFDVVFGRAVMHHARDLRAFSGEAARVLRPGGMLLVVREHVISRPSDLARFQQEHPLHRHYGGECAYVLADYREAIQRSGLRLTHVLNPYASDINLFPDTRAALRARTAMRLRLTSPALLPTVLLTWMGARLDAPGRLYSFVARKRHV